MWWLAAMLLDQLVNAASFTLASSRFGPICAPAAPPMCKDSGFQRTPADRPRHKQANGESPKAAPPCQIRLCERRGWDSNPRVTWTATAGFQDSFGCQRTPVASPDVL